MNGAALPVGPGMRVAVVGGGQAAKALLLAIGARASHRDARWRGVEVHVFERGEEFGTGLAWSRANALPEHLSSLASLQPRVTYGDGQLVQFARCVRLLEDFGVAVHLHPRNEIVDMEAHDGGWRLRTHAGASHDAQAVVLATGHWTTRDARPPGALRPWPAARLQHDALGSGHRVLVLGTSLTAVDAALTLGLGAGAFSPGRDGGFEYAAHRKLEIVLASRSGALPAVWGAHPRPWPEFESALVNRLQETVRFDGALSLDAALEALAHACAQCGAGTLSLEIPGRPLARRMRRIAALQRLRASRPLQTLVCDIARARGTVTTDGVHRPPELEWQRMLLTALPVFSEHYPHLPAEDQQRFETALRGPLYRHAMPMVLPTAQRLAALADAGVLTVRRIDAGTLRRDPGGGWLATDRDGRTLRADHVVDALGQSTDTANADNALLVQGLRRSHLRPARRVRRAGGVSYTGGIEVDPLSRRVRPDGERPPLYAMGVLSLGLFIDAQAIGHLLRDADRIVADLEPRLRCPGIDNKEPVDVLHR